MSHLFSMYYKFTTYTHIAYFIKLAYQKKECNDAFIKIVKYQGFFIFQELS